MDRMLRQSEAPRFISSGDGSRHASLQQEPRFLGRRYPGSDIALHRRGTVLLSEQFQWRPYLLECRKRRPQSGQLIRPAEKLASKTGPPPGSLYPDAPRPFDIQGTFGCGFLVRCCERAPFTQIIQVDPFRAYSQMFLRTEKRNRHQLPANRWHCLSSYVIWMEG